MALLRKRVNAVPAAVVPDRTKTFSPLKSAHAGRELDRMELTPGAVEATTLEPAGSASASMRANALYRMVLDASTNVRLQAG